MPADHVENDILRDCCRHNDGASLVMVGIDVRKWMVMNSDELEHSYTDGLICWRVAREVWSARFN